ncbi:MAG: YhjD/YihY/BrkB family envelope integrity protein [Actinomycetota bacterium]|nr:YhjD/YihY/BrkB family envelope integrity protein [Actinomycetota bacterium]
MAAITSPPPIPGKPIDPPPKDLPKVVGTVDERSRIAGIAYRALNRFSFANASLLAAGTTYYLFITMFALLAFAYGAAAALGSDQLTASLSDALERALPGLTGTGGIDPDQLREIGQGTSLAGLLLLLYSGSGAMVAASNSLHLIYGALPDPRNFVAARARLLGWLLIIAPLILLSFAIPNVIALVARSVDGFASTGIPTAVWTVGGFLVTLIIDFAIVYLLLGVLGGIRPEHRARIVGAVVGAIGISVLKSLLAVIISWSIAKPEYGAFAAPIAVLLILYLLTLTLYASASITAGVADRDVALKSLTPTDPDRNDDS